jgi:glucose/arabinose dehydrogenase
MRAITISILAITAFGPLIACDDAKAQDRTIQTEKAKIHVKTVAKGLEYPWALAFLPDGNMLVTERENGHIRVVTADGVISQPVTGVPAVLGDGQGGLLDLILDPDFSNNRHLYFSFSQAGEDGKNSTAVARARLSDDNAKLENLKIIFVQLPKENSSLHFGSRLVFDREGHLFIGLGERSDANLRGQAQQLNSHLGKLVRINADGSVPKDNPFTSTADARPEIWSYGHRNIQGAALNPVTGVVWVHEHGPRGGDEINIPLAGKNYGWPLVSYGVNYIGTKINEGKATGPGIANPVHVWKPSIAPSGMAFYTGDAIPAWTGNLFIGGLAIPKLVRLTLNGDKIVGEEAILADEETRIRDVRQGPDGALYLLTDDSDGEIWRISPAK